MESRKIKLVRDAIGVGQSVADELLILAGGDVDLVIEASRMSPGLDQCKAHIIDMRFAAIEEEYDQ